MSIVHGTERTPRRCENCQRLLRVDGWLRQSDNARRHFLTMNDENKVERMTKVWNAPWAMREVGWM
jgi:hypothetical protein